MKMYTVSYATITPEKQHFVEADSPTAAANIARKNLASTPPPGTSIRIEWIDEEGGDDGYDYIGQCEYCGTSLLIAVASCRAVDGSTVIKSLPVTPYVSDSEGVNVCLRCTDKEEADSDQPSTLEPTETQENATMPQTADHNLAIAAKADAARNWARQFSNGFNNCQAAIPYRGVRHNTSDGRSIQLKLVPEPDGSVTAPTFVIAAELYFRNELVVDSLVDDLPDCFAATLLPFISAFADELLTMIKAVKERAAVLNLETCHAQASASYSRWADLIDQPYPPNEP